ncbi:hypothetical protein GDO78_020650 [Eleutherodactylus coqui]|uniref:Uncharacterized protein n=1 Tax=Eleutherodactylus coqui TaxID=57060 RepID=A0A8J6EI64_ELECQ|nr:hypothetical protein GDO78_020650 [Eleutherodactylus coqui]
MFYVSLNRWKLAHQMRNSREQTPCSHCWKNTSWWLLYGPGNYFVAFSGPVIDVKGTLNTFGNETILADHINPHMMIVLQKDNVTQLEMSGHGWKRRIKTSKYFLGPLVPQT